MTFEAYAENIHTKTGLWPDGTRRPDSRAFGAQQGRNGISQGRLLPRPLPFAPEGPKQNSPGQARSPR